MKISNSVKIYNELKIGFFFYIPTILTRNAMSVNSATPCTQITAEQQYSTGE